MTLKITQDDNRKKDEAQLQQLQQQIDEVRRMLREQTGRHSWNEEQHKQIEARIVNLQTQYDQQFQDIVQGYRSRQAEDQRLKRQIGELEQKIEEPLKPLRDLKAQITELADHRKKDRDDSTLDKRVIDDLARQVREFQGQVAKVNDQYRQEVDKSRNQDIQFGQFERELQRVNDLQRAEEQRARRDVIEVTQRIEDIKNNYNSAAAKVQRLEELRKQDMTFVEEQVSRLDPLFEEDRRLDDWISRVEQNAQEKQQILRERIEEIRIELELHMSNIRTSYSQQIDRLNNRIEEVDNWCRELEGKLLYIMPKLDELYQADNFQAEEMQKLEEDNLRVQIQDLQKRYDEVRQKRLARVTIQQEPLRPRMIHNDPEEGGFVQK